MIDTTSTVSWHMTASSASNCEYVPFLLKICQYDGETGKTKCIEINKTRAQKLRGKK